MADLGAPDQGTGFSKRLGPLPYWAWIAIVTAGAVVGWVWWRSRKSEAPAATPQSTVANADGIPTEQFESIYAILRDLQGRLSTTPGDTTTPPPTDDTPVYVNVPEGTYASRFLRDHPEYGLTLAKLKELNPDEIVNAGRGGYGTGDVPVINSANWGGKIRVK